MKAQLRVALVGAGVMGNLHARALQQASGARLVIVVDRHRDRAQKIADHAGCRASDRLEDALACDIAIVATPPDQHTEAAVAFLQAGRPVLVEKPLADQLGDIQLIVEMSERSGVPLMCGFVERFNAAVTAASNLLIEAPVHMVAVRHSPPVPHVRTGVIHDLLIHDIDLAIRFTGDLPIERVCPLFTGGSGGAVEEAMGCVLGFEDGATASLSASRAGAHKVRSFLVETPSFCLQLDLVRQEMAVRRRIFEGPNGPAFRNDATVAVPWIGADEGPLARQLRHFLALSDGQEDANQERRSVLAPHIVAARLVHR